MSLVPTYVAAKDGNFYKNPVLFGEYKLFPDQPGLKWFICWDDDDPVELVIEDNPNHDSVVGVLYNAGLVSRVIDKRGKSDRPFPHFGWGKLLTSTSFWIELFDPIPVPPEHQGAIKRPNGECVIYNYGMTMPPSGTFKIVERGHYRFVEVSSNDRTIREQFIRECETKEGLSLFHTDANILCYEISNRCYESTVKIITRFLTKQLKLENTGTSNVPSGVR